MEPAHITRVLVVANRTAATPWLLEEIAARSEAGPCEFDLMVPLYAGHQADWTLDVALAHVEQAAGRPVQTVECDRDHVGAVQRALGERHYDEVIVSMCPPPGPRWLNRHPFSWLDDLEVPVTTVMLGERMRRERGVLMVRWDDALNARPRQESSTMEADDPRRR